MSSGILPATSASAWALHTVQRNQDRDGFPDAPPPRVSRDAEHDRKAGDDGEPNPELAEVARGAPDHAELLVLLLAAVRDAHRERAALVVRVLERAAVPARDLDHLELAAAVEAKLDDDGVVDDVVAVHDKPVGMCADA